MPQTQTNPTHDSGAAPKRVRVGDLLVAKGLVTPEQIDKALAFQKDRGHQKLLGEVLIELEYVTEEQVMEALAEAYGIPYVHLEAKVSDPAVIDALPRDFQDQQCVLPLFLVNGKLTLAVAEPANVFIVEEVQRLTGHAVQLVAATAKDIQATLLAHTAGDRDMVIDELIDDIDEEDLTVVEQQITDLADGGEDSANESPVIKLVNYLLFAAVQEGASDIHIEPDDSALRVRYRVDGRLYQKMTPPIKMLPAVVSRIKIMAKLDISERRIPQDGGISIRIGKRPVDLRISTMPGKFGEKVVIRIIDKNNAMTGLDQIGFSKAMYDQFTSMISQPNGIVLVTGPTGSGKSTTLYAALRQINTESVNISTVEDPVEMNIPGINQFQTNEKAGFTFSAALRSLLRQDPDIVMLGEIRDQETARIATQAALTGHMVLSTLHTNDAPSAITRLFNIGVEPYLVAASIRGALAQRLVRRVCKNCKETVEPADTMRLTIDRMGPRAQAIQTFYHGEGCKACRGTGYAGRAGIYELFTPNDEALDAITRGASLQELRQIGEASGYTTLQQDGLEKVEAGITTIEELVAATTH
jgi:type IV pilus assembly protein PilB